MARHCHISTNPLHVRSQHHIIINRHHFILYYHDSHRYLITPTAAGVQLTYVSHFGPRAAGAATLTAAAKEAFERSQARVVGQIKALLQNIAPSSTAPQVRTVDQARTHLTLREEGLSLSKYAVFASYGQPRPELSMKNLFNTLSFSKSKNKSESSSGSKDGKGGSDPRHAIDEQACLRRFKMYENHRSLLVRRCGAPPPRKRQPRVPDRDSSHKGSLGASVGSVGSTGSYQTQESGEYTEAQLALAAAAEITQTTPTQNDKEIDKEKNKEKDNEKDNEKEKESDVSEKETAQRRAHGHHRKSTVTSLSTCEAPPHAHTIQGAQHWLPVDVVSGDNFGEVVLWRVRSVEEQEAFAKSDSKAAADADASADADEKADGAEEGEEGEDSPPLVPVWQFNLRYMISKPDTKAPPSGFTNTNFTKERDSAHAESANASVSASAQSHPPTSSGRATGAPGTGPPLEPEKDRNAANSTQEGVTSVTFLHLGAANSSTPTASTKEGLGSSTHSDGESEAEKGLEQYIVITTTLRMVVLCVKPFKIRRLPFPYIDYTNPLNRHLRPQYSLTWVELDRVPQWGTRAVFSLAKSITAPIRDRHGKDKEDELPEGALGLGGSSKTSNRSTGNLNSLVAGALGLGSSPAEYPVFTRDRSSSNPILASTKIPSLSPLSPGGGLGLGGSPGAPLAPGSSPMRVSAKTAGGAHPLSSPMRASSPAAMASLMPSKRSSRESSPQRNPRSKSSSMSMLTSSMASPSVKYVMWKVVEEDGTLAGPKVVPLRSTSTSANSSPLRTKPSNGSGGITSMPSTAEKRERADRGEGAALREEKRREEIAASPLLAMEQAEAEAIIAAAAEKGGQNDNRSPVSKGGAMSMTAVSEAGESETGSPTSQCSVGSEPRFEKLQFRGMSFTKNTDTSDKSVSVSATPITTPPDSPNRDSSKDNKDNKDKDNKVHSPLGSLSRVSRTASQIVGARTGAGEDIFPAMADLRGGGNGDSINNSPNPNRAPLSPQRPKGHSRSGSGVGVDVDDAESLKTRMALQKVGGSLLLSPLPSPGLNRGNSFGRPGGHGHSPVSSFSGRKSLGYVAPAGLTPLEPPAPWSPPRLNMANSNDVAQWNALYPPSPVVLYDDTITSIDVSESGTHTPCGTPRGNVVPFSAKVGYYQGIRGSHTFDLEAHEAVGT